MKLFSNSLLIFTLMLLAGCNKEKPAEPTAAKPESEIFKTQIKTLHKAEDVSQATEDAIAAQRKKIDAETQ